MLTGQELIDWIKDNHAEKYVVGIVISFNQGQDEVTQYDIEPVLKTNINGTKEINL